MHARAARFADTDWASIDQLYATLEQLQPSPVVTLNRAVVVSKLAGPGAALEMLEPLAKPLDGYFYYYGVRGSLLRDVGNEPWSDYEASRAPLAAAMKKLGFERA